MSIPQEIVRQLGGNKFAAMTGATFMADGENTLVTKFKGSRIANIMYITLNEWDLYDVKICKFRGTEIKTVKELSGVYADGLVKLFEDATGLRARL